MVAFFIFTFFIIGTVVKGILNAKEIILLLGTITFRVLISRK